MNFDMLLVLFKTQLFLNKINMSEIRILWFVGLVQDLAMSRLVWLYIKSKRGPILGFRQDIMAIRRLYTGSEMLCAKENMGLMLSGISNGE